MISSLSCVAAGVCSTAGLEIPNSKYQITNKFQIFTLWNPAFGRFALSEIPQGKYQMTKTGLIRGGGLVIVI